MTAMMLAVALRGSAISMPWDVDAGNQGNRLYWWLREDAETECISTKSQPLYLGIT